MQIRLKIEDELARLRRLRAATVVLLAGRACGLRLSVLRHSDYDFRCSDPNDSQLYAPGTATSQRPPACCR